MHENGLDKKNPQQKLLLTGGGSGGHLNTAIAVIARLKVVNRNLYDNLIFVGSSRGMIGDTTPSIESRKIPELGIRFVAIRSGKFHRRLHWVTIRLLFGVVLGLLDAITLLRKEKPRLVFSTGGYVTVPVVLAALLLRIPVIVHEQTITSGLANRISARFADKVLITFPNSKKYFPASKVVLTGNALQESRFSEDLPENLPVDYAQSLRSFAQKKANLNNTRPFIFVTGGGLGSHKLNSWVLENIIELTSKYNILLQTGENQLYKDYDVLQTATSNLPVELRSHIIVIKWFSAEIGFILTHSDLVISRPGANSVLEFLARDKRAILVPIPWSANNEQQLNAEYFCSHQSGSIVAEKDISTKLLESIPEVLRLLPKSTKSLVQLDATERIVNMLSEYFD